MLTLNPLRATQSFIKWILFLFSIWIHNLWWSLSTITLGSWKDLSSYDFSNTEWQESENGFGVRETGAFNCGSAAWWLGKPSGISSTFSEPYFPQQDSDWMVNAKCLAQHLVPAQHSTNNMFIRTWVSNEIGMVPEVLGNLPNMEGKTRYRNRA